MEAEPASAAGFGVLSDDLIAVFDRHPLYRQGLVTTLMHSGFRVCEAESLTSSQSTIGSLYMWLSFGLFRTSSF